jgi:DNA repair protein RadA/Sms
MVAMSYVYVCLNCAARSPEDHARCQQCGEYGTLVSRTSDDAGVVRIHAPGSILIPIEDRVRPAATSVPIGSVVRSEFPRVPTGWTEVDRVLGDGFVPGSSVLIAGSPGAGKSTLLLGISNRVASVLWGGRVLYATGEEPLEQIRMRGERIGALSGNLHLVHETNLDAILALAQRDQPRLLIVDSIQTMRDPAFDQAAGSVLQVRQCAARLVEFAQMTGAIVVLVGHVTKDGAIGGPRTLDHLVDVVLYLEDAGGNLRRLVAPKNRNGDTAEVGILEMTATGLRSVEDGSTALPAVTDPGVVRFPALLGDRAVVLEIEALVGEPLGEDRRGEISASGVDRTRVARVIAILARHTSVRVADRDVYLSVSGGHRIADPCGDLAIAVAIASSFSGVVWEQGALCGELALTGAVRGVTHHEARRVACKARGVTLIDRAHLTDCLRIDPAPLEIVSSALDVEIHDRAGDRSADLASMVGVSVFDDA